MHTSDKKPVENSYSAILKSSSLVGGSSAIGFMLGLVSAKAGAVFLGPEGVGLLRLFQSTIAAIQPLASLGLYSAGTREIADANALQDEEKIKRIRGTFWWIALASGFLGWGLLALMAIPICVWSLGSKEHVPTFALSGGAVLFAMLTANLTASLQGLRRISTIAKANILSAGIGTILTIAFYWMLGKQGIVPAILSGSVAAYASFHFLSKNELPPANRVSIQAAVGESSKMLNLGLSLMWVGLSSSIVPFATSALIIKNLGESANGFYSAAWTISGVFANFILAAMGMDFLPRLTAVQRDNKAVCRLVNEQTEIGILVSQTGLVGTILFAPYIIEIIFNKSFIYSSELIPWMILGVYGRILSWPMGYILIAKGHAKLFALNDVVFNIVWLMFIIMGLYLYQLHGIAASFFLIYIFYVAWMMILTRKLYHFCWNKSTLRLFSISAILLLLAAIIHYSGDIKKYLFFALLIVFITIITSVHGITKRKGSLFSKLVNKKC